MTTTLYTFCAAVLAASLAVATGPAFAQVTQEQRKACERKAADVRPILNAPELEQFIANCLADATVESGSSSGKKSGGKY